jgi:hypothetical protein
MDRSDKDEEATMKIQFDREAHRRYQVAVVVFALGSVLTTGSASAWGMTDYKITSVIAGTFFLFLTLSALNYGMYRPLSYYRCPQCGEGLPRVERARPAVHYLCKECHVEWDLGFDWKDSDTD